MLDKIHDQKDIWVRDTLYKNFFYANEYVSQIYDFSPKMWYADKDIDQLEGDILDINGIPYYLKSTNNSLDFSNL